MVAPLLLVALHGKFDPSAFRGLLSGLPYGGGDASSICEWHDVAEIRVTTEVARKFLTILGLSRDEFAETESWMCIDVSVCMFLIG